MNIDLYKKILIEREYLFDANERINSYRNKNEEMPNGTTHLYFDEIKNISPEEKNIITHITMRNDNIKILKPGDIPDNVIDIDFGETNEKRIYENVIPHGVKKIRFGFATNEEIFKKNILPDSVEVLILPCIFSKPLDFIPKNTKILNLGHFFDKKLEKGFLPEGLTHLTFGQIFNQPLEPYCIPESVIQLYFGDNFDQEINENTLPRNIEYLSLGGFNKIISKNVIPESVKHLKMTKYNEILNKEILPLNIVSLNLYSYNQELTKDSLPNNIKQLIFGINYDKEINLNDLPDSLIEILFDSDNEKYGLNGTNISQLLNKNNILVGYFDNKYVRYHNIDIKYDLNYDLKYRHHVNKFIENIEKNLFGQIIKQELIEKVLEPNRLSKICDKYNITFQNLIKNY